MLLNQQSILEINAMREETVKEWFITFKKITVLIYEAIQIDIWKQKVFPILIEINEEPTNTFLLYSIFYHESLATSLLENVLFHSNSADAIDDSALDLVDYAVNKVTTLFVSNDTDLQKNPNESNTCLEELLKRKFELEFDIAMKCISILRYLAEFLDNLPLCVLSRMLTTHDVPYLLCKLIEKKPWKKENENGESMIYNGKWEIINLNDAERISKIEGQAWIGLRELLLNPKCVPYYEINDFRMSELFKLQKYLHEYILDQISPLIDLRRWLMQLSLSAAATTDQKTINIELMSQIRSSILEKYHKKWKKLARSQSNYLFTENIQYIRHIAQILSEAYNLDKLDYLEMRKCFGCNEPAKKRCSKCKTAWYCSRECQVKDWINHKINCIQ
ncbi:zinc finger MYND domain-containing protein 10 isoform X2 [Cephus cinctus]|nr:zinc finger MYND domain-containing protein 10 isoform X2 [Cephus cinctus]XP_024939487.1 zinc finger MYND domain-containing protein 10 isoform X2 [Cephus cinctus]